MNNNLKDLLNYVKNQSADIQKALKWYTTENFEDFNEALRNKKLDDKKLDDKKLDLLDLYQQQYLRIRTAFVNAPILKSPLIVYRGLQLHSLQQLNLKDATFLSTSLSLNQAEKFSGQCCILHITILPGSKILPLYNISNIKNEQEILLDIGTLEITGTNENNIYCTYKSEILSNTLEFEDTEKYNKMLLDISTIISDKIIKQKKNDNKENKDDKLSENDDKLSEDDDELSDDDVDELSDDVDELSDDDELAEQQSLKKFMLYLIQHKYKTYYNKVPNDSDIKKILLDIDKFSNIR